MGGDAMGPGLPEEAFTIGKRIIECFSWIQDELSSKPHTFNHGDVKPPNMFMMPGEVPAFIDWQYTAVGKGCQDIAFFLIEGYDIDECRRLEPIVMAHYHAALVQHGIHDYSFDDLKRDWKLACMHFPMYVAFWFGTTPDENLVDPGFPRRFVPRAFDAVLRNCAHELLPREARAIKGLTIETAQLSLASAPELDVLSPVPSNIEDCQKALIETRAALSDMRRQRDAYKAALKSIASIAANAMPPEMPGSPDVALS